jgi:hypothetical protein
MSEPTPKLSRRRVFAGAGTAGALAAAAVALPVLRDAETKGDGTTAKPAKGGGYQVTEHVLRYYQTARI